MRLVGATTVRDAADIIEPFVRHNLTLLDGLAIVDHGSSDGTSDILAALVAERLPVFVARGRPRTSPKVAQRIRELAAQGVGKQKTARTLKVGVSVVQRVVASA